MAQITNALAIREIEQILFGDNPHYEARAWTAAGVECRRDRHRYAGHGYGFVTDILQLRCSEPGRSHWEALIVAEHWAKGTPETVIKRAKWMKLVSGKSSDVRDWIRRHRPLRVA